jgi:hypothetical protein
MVPIGRHKLSMFRALLLLLPLLLALWWLSTRRHRPDTAFDDALDRALRPVLEQRDVQSKLGTAGPTQTRLAARESALASVPYLAPRDLELWASLRQRAAEASPATCARLWKGADDEQLGKAVAQLGDEALTSYAELLARGFALRLERKPAPAVPPDALKRGFAAVGAALSPEERAAFEADAARPDVSDERACELFITLSRGIAELEPAARADFYRALSRGLKAD